jgi:hypothetical protein
MAGRFGTIESDDDDGMDTFDTVAAELEVGI